MWTLFFYAKPVVIRCIKACLYLMSLISKGNSFVSNAAMSSVPPHMAKIGKNKIVLPTPTRHGFGQPPASRDVLWNIAGPGITRFSEVAMDRIQIYCCYCSELIKCDSSGHWFHANNGQYDHVATPGKGQWSREAKFLSNQLYNFWVRGKE
jgi:hypothetical protein